MRTSARRARGVKPLGPPALVLLIAVALSATACDTSTSATSSGAGSKLASGAESPMITSSHHGTGTGRVVDESVTGSKEVLRTSSKVRIRATKESFRSGDPVVTVIRNKRSKSITATSGQTLCTIVTLQRRSGNDWQTEGPCEEGAPPGNVRIEPHSKVRVRIGEREGDDDLPTGTYRAVFRYRIGNSERPSYISYSETFKITD